MPFTHQTDQNSDRTCQRHTTLGGLPTSGQIVACQSQLSRDSQCQASCLTWIERGSQLHIERLFSSGFQ